MTNPFRSQSLVYRAIEDNEPDKTFLHNLILNPKSKGNYAILETLKPDSKEESDVWVAEMRKTAFISVMVCLPCTTEKQATAEAGGGTTETLKPIGFVTLHGREKQFLHSRQTAVGIILAAEFQGKGYGSEAIRWVIDWAFRTAGMHRVGINAASYNPRAIRLYEKLGFQHEGLEHEMLWYDGGWHDRVRLYMLEDQWRAIVNGQKDEAENGSTSSEGWTEAVSMEMMAKPCSV